MIRIPHIVRIGESIDGRIARILVEKKSDLILDNFGVWLAGIIRAIPPAQAITSVTLYDTGNTARTVNLYGSPTIGTYGGLTGTEVGVGSSSQAAARTDRNLVSQLGSRSNTSSGVWTSATGLITFSGSVLLSAGGTVREAGFFASWRDSGDTVRVFMLFRDVISDVVISAGKYAFVQYTIQL